MPRILIVDDEEDFRMLLRLSLEMVGHEVEEAATGQQALQRLGEEGLDLVLLDIRLPDLDGLDVLRRLADGHPPVAVMSAHADARRMRAEALGAGSVAYLEKPFELEQVEALVQKVGA